METPGTVAAVVRGTVVEGDADQPAPRNDARWPGSPTQARVFWAEWLLFHGATAR
jgi:hypothetical protein